MQFGLAPMEGVTDWPARIWFGQTSAPALMTTPFLRVTDTFPGRIIPALFCPELTWKAAPGGPGATGPRLIPQLMATNADDFARVAELILAMDAVGSVWVDLNCGCPSPVVVGGRAGSALLEHPDALGRFLESVVGRLGGGRASVKVRTGFSAAAEFPEILEVLRGQDLAQVAVHGRTRLDRYLGYARRDLIQQAAMTLAEGGVPVVGSGDICDLATADEATAAAPTAQSWIIGRGALRNPWIFSELRTRRAVTLPVAAITTALEVFSWLHELYWNDGQALLALWRDGVFEDCAEADPDQWARLLERIAIRGAVPGRRACSRTKMIWNYLRSSLPLGMRAGEVLRATTAEALTGAILGRARDMQVLEFTMIYDRSWDWVYNGSGRNI